MISLRASQALRPRRLSGTPDLKPILFVTPSYMSWNFREQKVGFFNEVNEAREAEFQMSK